MNNPYILVLWLSFEVWRKNLVYEKIQSCDILIAMANAYRKVESER